LIVNCITEKSHSSKGFYWRLGKGSKKISVSRVSSKIQKYMKKVSKPVIQYTLAGRKIKEYSSLSEALRAALISISQITRVAKGKQESTKGYLWKYR
jgi:hypothetical protein